MIQYFLRDDDKLKLKCYEYIKQLTNEEYASVIQIDGKDYLPLNLHSINSISTPYSISFYIFWKQRLIPGVAIYRWLHGDTARQKHLSGFYTLFCYPYLTLLITRFSNRHSDIDLQQIHVLTATVLLCDADNVKEELWVNEDLYFNAEWKSQLPRITREFNKALREIRSHKYVVRKPGEQMDALLFSSEFNQQPLFDSPEEIDRFKLDVIREGITSSVQE